MARNLFLHAFRNLRWSRTRKTNISCVGTIMKCLNLKEISFNNFLTLRSVQQYRFNDTVIKIELGSHAVDRWLTYLCKISRGIPGFACSYWLFVHSYPYLSHFRGMCMMAAYAFHRFACDRKWCIQVGVDAHHFHFQRILSAYYRNQILNCYFI